MAGQIDSADCFCDMSCPDRNGTEDGGSFASDEDDGGASGAFGAAVCV